MEKVKQVRKKKKFQSPNPLFIKWLTEWKDDAVEKGLKSRYNYAKALKSLKKYPLPLYSGKEAKILEYFGDGICLMLDTKLKEHGLGLSQNGSDFSTSTNQANSATNVFPSAPAKVPPVKQKPKLPSKRKLSSTPSTSKQRAAPVATRLIAPSATNITIPAATSITVPAITSAIVPVVKALQTNVTADQEDLHNAFSLLPGTFDVVLCVDNMETTGGIGSKSKKQFYSQLEKCGVPFEVRKLHVGDFLWIAKERNLSATKPRELVLDLVVERKRLDDLVHSIKDGRFREQKFRLQSCGARHPIYLVENYRLHQSVNLPESTVEQAIINTQVVDGFTVKRTKDPKESVAYLTSMTKHLQSTLLKIGWVEGDLSLWARLVVAMSHKLQGLTQLPSSLCSVMIASDVKVSFTSDRKVDVRFKNDVLRSGSRQTVSNSNFKSRTYITFEDFNQGSVKNKCLTVREMFAKHLLQFHGLSVDRAAALVETFQTPSKLFAALGKSASAAESVKFLAEIRYGKYQKIIGQTLGKAMQQYYSTERPLL